MAHAKMTITVDRHFDLNGNPSVQIELEGCGNCLAAAVATGMLTNDKFKKNIAAAVKAANEKRAKTEN